MQAIQPIWEEKFRRKWNETKESRRRSSCFSQKTSTEGAGRRTEAEESKDKTACKRKFGWLLLKEAENKFKKAVQTGDVTDINVAQTLLETAQLKRAEERVS